MIIIAICEKYLFKKFKSLKKSYVYSFTKLFGIQLMGGSVGYDRPLTSCFFLFRLYYYSLGY